MLIEYSSDTEVRRAVAQLMNDTATNPYTGRPATISDILAVIVHGFGRKAAGSVKITLH